MGRASHKAGQRSDKIDMALFPSINLFLHKPLLVDPPLCSLKDLQDGTYSIDDLALMHDLIDLKVAANDNNN